jgi:putative ABC transport system permease protein
MTLVWLSFKNAFRNKTRAFLTLAGVAVLTVAFIFLRTTISAWMGETSTIQDDRIIVRNRISLTFPLPESYTEKVRSVPGVDIAAGSSWFGGTYKDGKIFFATFAVEAEPYFKIFEKNLTVSPEAMKEFQADRTGALIGEGLAKKLDLKVGSVVSLKGDIYPGDWKFMVRGFFKAKDEWLDQSLYFHQKYLTESVPERRQGYIGTITVLVKDAAQSPRVCKDIDALFANSAHETLTESEKAFNLSFVTGSEAIIKALEAVSLVLLVIMLLILGNTLAMAVRERTGEIAVLRTIGFVPRQMMLLALSEGLWLGLLGGALGLVLANPLLSGFAKVAENFFVMPKDNPWLWPALGIAVAMGLVAGAIPSWQASRVDVVSALRRAE